MARSYKVGFNQIRKATPAFILRLRKAVLYATGGIGAFIPLIIKWTGWDAETIVQFGGFSVLLLSGIAELFGVPITTDTVPTEDVASIETNN